MKIITGNAVYVQKKDIAHLCDIKLPVFWSLYIKIYGNGFSLLDDNEKYEFVKFSKQKEIDFFRNLDWIMDYCEVKDLTQDEVLDLFYKSEEDRKKVAQKLNAMSSLEREKNNSLVMLQDFLNFKMCSLKDILLFKQGLIQMNFPENGETSPNIDSQKGIRELVRSRFKKRKLK